VNELAQGTRLLRFGPGFGLIDPSRQRIQPDLILSEGGAALPDLDEGLLYQVPGCVGVPQRAHSIAIQDREERAIEFPKCPLDGRSALAAGAHE
jgi:hypothetical protein